MEGIITVDAITNLGTKTNVSTENKNLLIVPLNGSSR